MHFRPHRILAILAVTQVVSWGTLYYAFSVLAPDIERELGWRPEIVFGAFSWSLLVAGLASAPVGMLLDRFGGRPVMGLGSLIAGLGLIVLSAAQSVAVYFFAWSVIGAAMAFVLYEAAFATINREFPAGARKGISTLTLFGGLASTVFWPVTLKLSGMLGWRDTYLVYGLVQILLCLPAHLLLTVRQDRSAAHGGAAPTAGSYTLREAIRLPVFWNLACAFAANSFIFSALAVHLIPVLNRLGHPMATAVFLATLIGPMQVAGRLGELVFAGRTQPQAVGRVIFSMLPAALLALIMLGAHEWAVALFCMLYGLSNGIMTIVRGTVPQALFGRSNYGAIAGALAGPSLFAKAAGPLVFAGLLQASPEPHIALWMLFGCAVLSLAFYLAAIRHAATSRPPCEVKA